MKSCPQESFSFLDRSSLPVASFSFSRDGSKRPNGATGFSSTGLPNSLERVPPSWEFMQAFWLSLAWMRSHVLLWIGYCAICGTHAPLDTRTESGRWAFPQRTVSKLLPEETGMDAGQTAVGVRCLPHSQDELPSHSQQRQSWKVPKVSLEGRPPGLFAINSMKGTKISLKM